MEIFKDVKGYEGLYEISNIGRLKSLPRNTTRGGIKKLFIVKGYYCSNFNKEGKHKQVKIHRLIAEVFVPNPNNYDQVNHKDGNKLNNDPENLEWCTARENTTHRDKKRLNRKSKYHGVSYEEYKGKKYWRAYVYWNKKSICIGFYSTEEEAHEAHIKFLKENNIINKYALTA